jgi:hypothetical protein
MPLATHPSRPRLPFVAPSSGTIDVTLALPYLTLPIPPSSIALVCKSIIQKCSAMHSGAQTTTAVYGSSRVDAHTHARDALAQTKARPMCLTGYCNR